MHTHALAHASTHACKRPHRHTHIQRERERERERESHARAHTHRHTYTHIYARAHSLHLKAAPNLVLRLTVCLRLPLLPMNSHPAPLYLMLMRIQTCAFSRPELRSLVLKFIHQRSTGLRMSMSKCTLTLRRSIRRGKRPRCGPSGFYTRSNLTTQGIGLGPSTLPPFRPSAACQVL